MFKNNKLKKPGKLAKILPKPITIEIVNIVLLSVTKKFNFVNVISSTSLAPHPVKNIGVACTIKVKGPNNSQTRKLDSGNIALAAKKRAILNNKT